MALFLSSANADEPLSSEYPIKAAFLYRFGNYIEWPPTAFNSPESPFTICIIGKDPFGSTLDRLADGERSADRPIAIKRTQTPDGSLECQVIYIAAKSDLAPSLRAVSGRHVLTVTDGVDETGAHGIINFVLRDNRVRFNIDMRLAVANELGISSRLLSLALVVNGRDGPKNNLP